MGQPEAILGGRFGVGEGPVYLNQLRCDSDERNLLQCQSGQPHGLVTCSDSHIVGVQCPGTPSTS